MLSLSLPVEIRLMIIQALVDDGCSLAPFAAVSRDWSAIIEQHTFRRIRLTPSRIAELNAMTSRNRARVRSLWLCLELERYDCTGECDGDEFTRFTSSREDALIQTALQDLFSALGTWKANGSSLSLDISVYSTSDSEHWFKHLTFGPDELPNKASWIQGGRQTVGANNRAAGNRQFRWQLKISRGEVPPMCAIDKAFAEIMGKAMLKAKDEKRENKWWRQLPLVPAVTHLLLRQQTRRRWKPLALAKMIARMPGLRELHYEPWREWDDRTQEKTDLDYVHLLRSPGIKGLSRLTIFENFHLQYAHAFSFPGDFSPPRAPSPALGQTLFEVSRGFESLSASFMLDASDFFGSLELQPSARWPNLTTLVLTSQLLAPDEDPADITEMLTKAASAVARMPQLKSMEIWNGREELAALFRYQLIRDQLSIITWRATWHLALQPSVIRAWEAVTARRSGRGLKLVYDQLAGENITYNSRNLSPPTLHCVVGRHTARALTCGQLASAEMVYRRTTNTLQ
ncbi:hypothetical protein N3K66_007480 [Trichothecium roseum]|uniref:Uncharacterized protein n=1 Tax=Trichothecium roseum TaxID=47278 RepID=A0ACC0UVR6_9HYPO|nr:hypothetical protein N3K66_007480 [Trichothecium roseum]